MRLKSSLFTLLLCCFMGPLCAQNSDSATYVRRSIEKGDFILSANYGAPSILRYFLRKETPIGNISLRGFGPFLLKGSYMISNKISLGITGSYNYSNVYWLEDGLTSLDQWEKFEAGARTHEISFLLRGDYHFYTKNNWDLYAGVGAGYGDISLDTYTDDPNGVFNIIYDIPEPFSFDFTAGARHFISKRLAINTEAGLGRVWLLFDKYFVPDALVQLGFSVKL